MRQVESLSHTRWECKYHIVFIPKYRRRVLFGQLRKELGSVFHRLEYAVSQVVGYIKGKSAIHIARTYLGRKKNYVGQHFWARGYFASTVGRDEQVIRDYIRHQEVEDRRIDQLQLM